MVSGTTEQTAEQTAEQTIEAETDVDARPTQALVSAEPAETGLSRMVCTVPEALALYADMREFVSNALKETVDYGQIPGVEKKVLFKAGAEKLGNVFGLTVHLANEELREDLAADPPMLYYRYKATVVRRTTGTIMAECTGIAHGREPKWFYRNLNRTCPVCGQEAIIKGKDNYGGGWVCWKKRNGCGGNFGDNDTRITSQQVGKIINPDLAAEANTICKIAQKRASVGAIIIASNASDYFTSDVEDYSAAQLGQQSPRNVTPPNEENGPPQEKVAPPAEPEPEPEPRLISTAQARRMFAIARDKGLNNHQVKAVVKRHGFDSSKAITVDAYEVICDEIERTAQAAQGSKLDEPEAEVNGDEVSTTLDLLSQEQINKLYATADSFNMSQNALSTILRAHGYERCENIKGAEFEVMLKTIGDAGLESQAGGT